MRLTYLQTHTTLYGVVHYVEKKPFITVVSLKHVVKMKQKMSCECRPAAAGGRDVLLGAQQTEGGGAAGWRRAVGVGAARGGNQSPEKGDVSRQDTYHTHNRRRSRCRNGNKIVVIVVEIIGNNSRLLRLRWVQVRFSILHDSYGNSVTSMWCLPYIYTRGSDVTSTMW